MQKYLSLEYKDKFAFILYGAWWKIFIIYLASLAWFSTPLMMLQGITTDSLAWFGAILSLFIFFSIIFLLNKKNTFDLINRVFCKANLNIFSIILLGLLIRIIWVLIFQAEPASDGKTYIDLALSLLNNNTYEINETKAFWPPGYSLFLVPWLYFFSPYYAVILSQSFLFVLGCFGCYKLTRIFSGEFAARLASLVFALWPNLIAQFGIPAKEILVLGLLPWVFILILKNNYYNFIAGLFLGAAILTQPSLQLLLFAVIVLIFLSVQKQSKWLNIILFTLGTVLIVAPWTVRNYFVFDRFILISTNSGYVLYRANNPLANGGYIPSGSIDLSHLSEIDKDTEAKKLAKKWIRENPTQFLVLSLKKQLRFMGDDAVGVYETLKRGKANDTELVYIFFKIVANVWWLLIWLLLAIFSLNKFPRYSADRLLLWGWLYLFIIHSIFESAGKYHVPMLWVLCVILGVNISQELQSIKNINQSQ